MFGVKIERAPPTFTISSALLTLLLTRVSFFPSRFFSYFLIIEKTWRLPIRAFENIVRGLSFYIYRFEKNNFSQQLLSNYTFGYRLFPFFNVHKVYSFRVRTSPCNLYDEIVLRRVLNKRTLFPRGKGDVYVESMPVSFSVNAISHARFTKSLRKSVSSTKRNKNSRKEFESSNPPCSSRERNIFEKSNRTIHHHPPEFFLLEIYSTYKSRRK